MRWCAFALLVVVFLAACPAPMEPLAGAPCTQETVGRCDAEAPRLLQCTGGTWAIYSDCKGPMQCTLSQDTAECDTSGNSLGDRCAPTSEGKVRCDPDGGVNILRCVGATLELEFTCPQPLRCGIADAGLTCI